jgi:hypothetical protein
MQLIAMFSRVPQSKENTRGTSPRVSSRALPFSQPQAQSSGDELQTTEQPLQSRAATFKNSFERTRIFADRETGEHNREEANRVKSLAGAADLDISFTRFVNPQLPPQTPAWTENGSIYLSPYALLLPGNLPNVVAHERVHAIHHRMAARDESNKARLHAESLASSEGSAFELSVEKFLQPVPGLLAFPPQNYKPWDRVIVGNAGIIGEIVESGVTVRIYLSYKDLKVERLPEYQDYVCRNHGASLVGGTVKKMREIAKLAAQFNNSIPKSAEAKQVALISVDDTAVTTGYRLANGKGMIWLKGVAFRSASYKETIFHEASHAIFEAHSPTGGTPDPFPQRIADLYGRLKDTRQVVKPSEKFKTKKPPLTAGDAPAGVAMVADVLWSKDKAAGHPWDDVSEFFASAYGCFRFDKDLLSALVDYYAAADPKIGKLKPELFDLLETATDPDKAAKVKAPTPPDKALEIAKAVKPTPDESKDASSGISLALVDPSKLLQPAGDIPCPGDKTKTKPSETPKEPKLADPDDEVEKILKGSDK